MSKKKKKKIDQLLDTSIKKNPCRVAMETKLSAWIFVIPRHSKDKVGNSSSALKVIIHKDTKRTQ